MLPYFYPFPRSYQEQVPSPGGKVIIDLRRDSNLREAAAVRDGQHHKVLAHASPLGRKKLRLAATLVVKYLSCLQDPVVA